MRGCCKVQARAASCQRTANRDASSDRLPADCQWHSSVENSLPVDCQHSSLLPPGEGESVRTAYNTPRDLTFCNRTVFTAYSTPRDFTFCIRTVFIAYSTPRDLTFCIRTVFTAHTTPRDLTLCIRTEHAHSLQNTACKQSSVSKQHVRAAYNAQCKLIFGIKAREHSLHCTVYKLTFCI